MLKNNRKICISKYFFLSIFVICLIFTSFGLNVENSYAVDVNESNEEMDMEVDAQDKLENSQPENNVLEESSDENEVLGATHYLNGGTFKDIYNTIKNAQSGDVIQLSNTFTASDDIKRIKVTKRVTITSTSQATLDGRGISRMFYLTEGAQGTVISNLRFVNGLHENRGGAILIWANDVTVSDCVFENNHAGYGGGAISSRYAANYGVNTVVKNCVFRYNSAKIGGGALTLYGDRTQLIDCTFDSNYATNNEGVQVYGGAIQLSLDEVKSTASVSGCTFTNNWAKSNSQYASHGGAGCVRDGVSYTNCRFIGNSADEGGALTFHASGKITDCVFTENSATNFGGAISTGYLYNSMVLGFENCQFYKNSAPLGGAMQLFGENIDIKNSIFSDNYATQRGGAVNIEANTVYVSGSNFKNNLANVAGGAIFVKGQRTTIENSEFDSNDVVPSYNKLDDGLGGAIYVNSANAYISDNQFKFNTARNGSAVYYDKSGVDLRLTNNVMQENQAWVYALPIFARDIYFGDSENLSSVIYGGNNIAKYGNLAVSNAIYNGASNLNIKIDGVNPVNGATDSGELYQDDREYQIDILLTVAHEDGTVVYNNTLKSSYLGEISTVLNDLKPGKYYATAKHFEDTYYKAITNTTTFTVYPKVDNQITIASDKTVYDFKEVAVWTINVTNNGPNNSTEVIVHELLPEGLIYESDTSGGLYDPKTGILNISTLDVGEKLSFNIVTVINKTGEILNDVNITAKELDTNLTNNLDEQLITVNPACDIQVIKSVNNTNPNYNDLVNWTIVIRNNGPDVAHNVSVCDVIPSALIPLNYTSKRLTWKIESLGVNEEVVFNVITVVNQTGVVENNVNASASEFDYDMSNNNDSEIINIDPACDLSIVKSVNATNVNYLDTVKWTLTVKNNGPDNATGVNITDILPDGFVYVNSTLDFVDGMIKIGNLCVGKTLSVDIICKVNTTGNYTNFASVTASEYDPNLDNNKDNESITVNPAADLEISKTVDRKELNNGESLTWIIVIKNNGPDVAHNVRVFELLPSSLIWIEDDSLGDYNPETGILSVDVLGVGEKYEVNIICQANRTGIIVNNVNVTASEFDYNLTNNYANESIEVKPSADVNIIKLVNNTNPNYNDLVKWTVIVSNNGPNKATGVQVDEIIPEGLILVNSTPTKGIYDDGLWFVCCLVKGETQSLEIICRVNKTGVITNFVEINASEHDPNSTNNKDNESVNVPPAVDIEVIQEVNNTSPLYGEKITWMITVKNNGPDNATEVELFDSLPETLIFVDCNSTKGEYADGIWEIGDLNVGECEYLNITCIVNEVGLTVNDAEAVAHEYDWNKSNNHDDAEVNVLPVADLAIQKTVDNSNPNYGDVVTWNLIISNNGPNYASNVCVSDNLPEQLEFIKSSDDNNYHNGNWDVGLLQSGQTKQLSIQCKVIATGLINNTADVTSSVFDPNLDNNHAEKSISVAPASDLSISKIASKYKYVVGDVITYMIEVVNNGPDTAYNIKVDEVLDDLLKLKSFKVSKGSFNDVSNVWTIDYLRYGESATLYIKAVAMGSGTLKNTVVVTSDSFDYDVSNNKDSSIVKVVKKASKILSNEPKVKNSNLPGKNIPVLKLHKTANPLLLLLVSCVVSIIFLGDNRLKRR